MKSVKTERAVVAALMLAALAGCASQVDYAVEVEASGFWSGVWHGLTFPIAWIGSLFSDDIAVYAVPNNGGWYDFGFFAGVCVLGGGGASAT